MFIQRSQPGGERSDQGRRRARRERRERAQALQEAVRKDRAPVGVQETPTLREAQRPAEAQSPRRSQEGPAARTDARLPATLPEAPPALPPSGPAAHDAYGGGRSHLEARHPAE